MEKHCAGCGSVFGTVGELHIHLRQSEKCQHIGNNIPSVRESYEYGTHHETFNCTKPLKSLTETHHENYAYECFTCSKTFRTSTMLVMHITGNHDIPKAFKCGLCDAAFYENLLLLSHLQDSHDEQLRVYRCAVCKERYENITSLNTHISSSHLSCPAIKEELEQMESPSAHSESMPLCNEDSAGNQSRIPGHEMVLYKRHKDFKPEDRIQNEKCLQHRFPGSQTRRDKHRHSRGRADDDRNETVTDLCASEHSDDKDDEMTANLSVNFSSEVASSDSASMYFIHCHKCDGRFNSMLLLSRHLETRQCMGHQCPRCKRSFGLECSFLRHMAGHKVQDGLKDFTCQVCKKCFPSRTQYLRHSDVHTTLTPFCCKVCPKKFASLSGIQHHVKRIHICHSSSVTLNEKNGSAEKMLSADTVVRSSSSDNKSPSHVDADITDKPETWYCNYCERTFTSSKGYQSHVRSCHSFGLYSGVCHKCNGIFDSLNALTLHIFEQNCEGFKCSHCGKSFALENAFLRHVAGHRLKGGLESLDCETCGKRMETGHQYKYHAGTHATLPLLHCNVCKAQFAFPDSLYQHLKRHTDKFDLSSVSAADTVMLKRGAGNKSEETSVAEATAKVYKSNESYCADCRKEFRCTKSYLRHRSACHSEGYYFVLCYACSGRFESLDALSLHLSETQCEGYKCAECSQKFGLEYKYLQHVAWHKCEVGQTLWSCDVCGKSFPTETAYIRHADTHTTSTPLCCALCPRCFALPSALYGHLKRWHGLLYDRPHSSEHLPASAGSVDFSVEMDRSVNAPETTKASLQQAAVPPVSASTLGSLLTTNSRLKRKSPHGGAHLCNYCGKTFSFRGGLDTHIRVEHDKKLLECRFCPRKFRSNSSLFRHELYHGEKQHLCHLCDMTFFTKNELRIHSVTHSTAKPYQCPVCKMRFKRKQILSRHMVLHDPVRRYQCNQCDKAFKLQTGLVKHMKLHLDKREFKCHLCTAAFNRRAYLNIHMRTHTNEQPYQCPGCDRSFAHRSNRNSHMKRMHPHIKTDQCDSINQQADQEKDAQIS